MATVNLHGDLTAFGNSFNISVGSVAEAVRALDANCAGFRNHLLTKGHSYRLLVNGAATSEKLIGSPIHSDSVIDVVPVLSGAKSSMGMIIAGVALIAITGGMGGFAAMSAMSSTGVATLGGVAAQMAVGVGFALISAGITQVLAPTPKDPGNAEEVPAASQFNGPVNTVKQGMPVPVGYGRLIVGGATVSAGLDSNDIAPTSSKALNPWLEAVELLHYSCNYGEYAKVASSLNEICLVLPNLAKGTVEGVAGTEPAVGELATPLQDIYPAVSFQSHELGSVDAKPENHGYVIDSNSASKSRVGSVLPEDKSLFIGGARKRILRVEDFNIDSAVTLDFWVTGLSGQQTLVRYMSKSNTSSGTVLSSEFRVYFDYSSKTLHVQAGAARASFNLSVTPTIGYNRVYYSAPAVTTSSWKNFSIRIGRSSNGAGFPSISLMYSGVTISPSSRVKGVYSLGSADHELSFGGTWKDVEGSSQIYSGSMDSIRVIKGNISTSNMLSLSPGLKRLIDSANSSVSQDIANAEAQDSWGTGEGAQGNDGEGGGMDGGI